MGRDFDDMCLYIKARDELAEEARKLLAETAAKELKGEEGEALLKAFRDEAEAGWRRCSGSSTTFLKRQAFMHIAFQFWRLVSVTGPYGTFSFILRHSSTPISVS